MRAAAVLALTAAALSMPGPALAVSERMSLACEGLDLVVERSNGASWWGNDGAVYTTAYLRVVDDGGTYEKSYGHTASDVLICQADHVTAGYTSRWTVHLVRAQH